MEQDAKPKTDQELFFEAWSSNNYESMESFRNKKINTDYAVDVSLEEGNEKMTKYLLSIYNAKPSLYAKQMAEVNGHIQLAKYVESLFPLRNQISIANVHRKIDANKQFKWNGNIPQQYQFI